MFSSSFPRPLPAELSQAVPPAAPAPDSPADTARRPELPSRASSTHAQVVRNSTIAGALHRHGRAAHESRVADRVFVTVTRTTRTADDEAGTETTAVSEVLEQWTLPGLASADEADAASGIDADGGGGGGGGGGSSEMAEVSSAAEAAAEAPAAIERAASSDAAAPAAAAQASGAAGLDAHTQAEGTPAAGSVARIEPVKATRVVRPPRANGARQAINIIGAGLAVAVAAIVAALIISHGAPPPTDGAEDDHPPPAATER